MSAQYHFPVPFFHFGQNYYTLQRGLSAIAEFLQLPC